MQQKIQQFVFLSERILSEYGELRLRKTWNELHAVSLQLAPYMRQLSQNFDPKYALLFLLSCDNESAQKNGCFSMLFRKILSNIPNKAMINVLSAVNRVELNNYLLPFLYEQGDIGSIAAYTAATLGLKVKFDAFEFFLTSREWTQEDLVNLSFLALVDEKDSLILNIDEAYRTTNKEVFKQFLNVLNSSNVNEPVVPDIKMPEPSVNEKPAVKVVKPANKQQPQPTENKERVFKLSGVKPRSDLQRQSDAFKDESPAKQTIGPANETKPVQPVQQGKQEQGSKIVSILSRTNKQFEQNQKKNIPQTQNVKENQSTSQSDEKVIQPEVPENETSKADTKSNNLKNVVEKGKQIFGSLVEKASETTISFDPDDIKDGTFFKNIFNSLKEKFSGNGSDSDNSNSILRKPWVAIVAIVIVLIILICVMASGDIATSETIVKAPPKEGKIPDFWVDAVTNKQLTPQYIAADVDYRMGELYLARNVFNEAIKFFSDACQKEPKHYIAKMRWGFAEMMQGNYFASKKLFKEVYSAEPKLQNLNIYIARNYALENDSKSAIKHYKEEYKNHNELSSAMELANYLAYIGQQNDAMDLIATLQEKYPGKMLILKSFGEKSNN